MMLFPSDSVLYAVMATIRKTTGFTEFIECVPVDSTSRASYAPFRCITKQCSIYNQAKLTHEDHNAREFCSIADPGLLACGIA